MNRGKVGRVTPCAPLAGKWTFERVCGGRRTARPTIGAPVSDPACCTLFGLLRIGDRRSSSWEACAVRFPRIVSPKRFRGPERGSMIHSKVGPEEGEFVRQIL